MSYRPAWLYSNKKRLDNQAIYTLQYVLSVYQSSFNFIYGHQGQSKVAQFRDQTIQCRLVLRLSPEDSFTILSNGYFKILEPLRPVFVHLHLHPDFNLLHVFSLPNQLPELKDGLPKRIRYLSLMFICYALQYNSMAARGHLTEDIFPWFISNVDCHRSQNEWESPPENWH
jgi:hypothetical protein